MALKGFAGPVPGPLSGVREIPIHPDVVRIRPVMTRAERSSLTKNLVVSAFLLSGYQSLSGEAVSQCRIGPIDGRMIIRIQAYL
jgi:hypothetical protein